MYLCFGSMSGYPALCPSTLTCFFSPSLFLFLSMSFFPRISSHNVTTNQLPREKEVFIPSPEQERFLKVFAHRLHQLQLLRLLRIGKSSIWVRHGLQMRLWQLNLLPPGQSQWRIQLLLNYLKKHMLEFNTTFKRLWMKWEPSKLVNEAPESCKWLFGRARPIIRSICSLQMRL